MNLVGTGVDLDYSTYFIRWPLKKEVLWGLAILKDFSRRSFNMPNEP